MAKKILLIAGTRPNFIKLAPLYHRFMKEKDLFQIFICHTGQHFDFNMSDIFWQNLQLPKPDFELNIKGNNVADTIGKTIIGINEVLTDRQFDLVIVFGDVNATAAGAIAAAQAQVPVMHVEAGLRSFDRTMPEEINRVITDHVSDWLMVSEPSGISNLKKEGFDDSKMLLAGNIMIECLLNTKEQWQKTVLPESIRKFTDQKPAIVTFHRPENVDNPVNLKRVVEILVGLASAMPVIFPVHPRTMFQLEKNNLLPLFEQNKQIIVTEPLSYFEFLKLMSGAALVITDSGGIQEETSFLNIPCITFRKNTERPVTIVQGTNMLLGLWEEDYLKKIKSHHEQINKRKQTTIPLWDVGVSGRIVEFIKKLNK